VKSTLHRALARLRQELESRDLDVRALERGEVRRNGECDGRGQERCAA
jgi:hypothetical protein